MRNIDRTIIVGGGLAGATCLYELVKRGHEAVLLESHAELASGASFANGGLLTPSLPDPWNNPGVGKYLFQSLFSDDSVIKLHLKAIPGLMGWGIEFLRNSAPSRHRRATENNFKLAQYSVEQTRRVLADENIDFDLRADGTLKTFETAQSFEAQKELAEFLAPIGLRYEILSPEEAIEKEPQLADAKARLHSAIFYPDDCFGDARAFTGALGQRAHELGADIRMNIEVSKIKLDRDRVTGVETSNGVIEGANVIVAAGNAAPRLVRPLGVRLPIAPAKGYSLTIDMSGWNARPEMAIVDDATHYCATPMGDKLRCVSVADFSGNDDSIAEKRIEHLYRLLNKVYPHLSANVDRKRTESWAGLRPMSADGVPFIGGTKMEGLWINAGHSHLGWTMAMGSAALLTDLMTGKEPDIDPHPYRLHR